MGKKLFEQVYEVVRSIPVGKVATYGQIARLVNSSSSNTRITPRVVGWALHANRDPDTPCHRVVDRNGRLAPNFAFDGPKEQKRRLVAEEVKFKNESHVDLNRYKWERK